MRGFNLIPIRTGGKWNGHLYDKGTKCDWEMACKAGPRRNVSWFSWLTLKKTWILWRWINTYT